MPLAGKIIRALDFPPHGSGQAISFWNTTSTSYVKTVTAGTTPAAGFTFTAPTSGAVRVTLICQLGNSAAGNGTRLSAEVRAGGTVGSGALISDTADQRSIVSEAGDDVNCSRSYPVTGLDPGATYNVDPLWRVSAGTGQYDDLQIIVEPLT